LRIFGGAGYQATWQSSLASRAAHPHSGPSFRNASSRSVTTVAGGLSALSAGSEAPFALLAFYPSKPFRSDACSAVATWTWNVPSSNISKMQEFPLNEGYRTGITVRGLLKSSVTLANTLSTKAIAICGILSGIATFGLLVYLLVRTTYCIHQTSNTLTWICALF
jgi:hypothetical protein